MGVSRWGAALLAAISIMGSGQARESITWITIDLPPATIFDGPMAGKGFGDQQLRILFAALPDYDHQIIRGTIARGWHELETRDGLCINWVSRSSGKHWYALFSKRPVPNPGYRLLIKSSRMTEFLPYGRTGEIDLDLVGRNDALSGAFIASRDYLAPINDFIKAGDIRLQQAMNTQQLVELLHADRVDFIFATPFEVAFYKDQLHLQDQFVPFRIKGGPPFNEGYIACSSGPVGRAVLDKIDAYLQTPDGWAAYVAPLQRWLDPADFAFAQAGKSR